MPLYDPHCSVVSDFRNFPPYGGAQCANNSAGGANVVVFILWLWTFADKTGGYAVFGAVPPILVVGINGVGTDSGDFYAGQFLLIISPSSDCPV